GNVRQVDARLRALLGGAARAFRIGEMQLAADVARGTLFLVVAHAMRSTRTLGLVAGRIFLGACGRFRRFVPARMRGRRIGSIGRFNRHAARGGGGLGFRHGAFFLGTLALGLGGFELLLLFLAATVLLGQIGQFAFVLFLRFLQFAQRVLALAVYHLVTRNSSTLDIRATRAHFDVDGLGAGATAAGHGDFADLAALQRDLLRRRGRGGFLLAMVAAQEIKQLGLLAIADDLVGAFELHAGLGE